jgi:hypothetical protein
MALPASLRVLGLQAFGNCTRLTAVEFAEESRLEVIDAEAFAGCTMLSRISLPVSARSLDQRWAGGSAIARVQCAAIQSVPGFVHAKQFLYVRDNMSGNLPARRAGYGQPAVKSILRKAGEVERPKPALVPLAVMGPEEWDEESDIGYMQCMRDLEVAAMGQARKRRQKPMSGKVVLRFRDSSWADDRRPK